MRLVHTLECVVCGKKEYHPVPVGAKSSRKMLGMCDKCVGGEENETQKEDGKASKPKGVSPRRAGSA